MSGQKTYVCKRARMCSFLMERGFNPYRVAPDRDNPMYDVFLFTASPELYQAVMEYINQHESREMKIYLLIHWQDTDAACGCDVRLFTDRQEAQDAMHSDWQDAVKGWGYDAMGHKDEDECGCGETAAVIRSGSDVENWRIEEHGLNVSGFRAKTSGNGIKYKRTTIRNFTLRGRIEETKAEYLQRYGSLDWQYTDEGLPWTIQDYHSSKGSVMDFTEDDWLACKENGWTLNEVLELCGEEYLDNGFIADYMTDRISEWRDDCIDQHAADSEIPKEIMLGFVEDFYTWRKELLPKVEEIYSK